MANMHLITGYAGQPHVTAADQGSMYAALFGNGSYVLNRGNKFAATVVTSNTIQIADGDLMIQGRHARLDGGLTVDLSVDNGANGYNRNDLIVARYTKSTGTGVEDVNLMVIKGTATTGTAADPACVTGDIIDDHDITVDVPLYRIPIKDLTVQNLVPLFTVFDNIPAQVKEAKDIAKAAMPKGGGTFTGNVIAATTTDGATAMLRNIVVVEADTDLATLSVPAGTIIMQKK